MRRVVAKLAIVLFALVSWVTSASAGGHGVGQTPSSR